MTDKSVNEAERTDLREVPISWEALEDAFENNAHEVHSYLHLDTGEVIRVVDGVADPGMHHRIMGDSTYLRVDPVSSREQYRWMERFIATVDDEDLKARLMQSIDGKGAFRRFKDVLMLFPVDRERWFSFRSERLRACMEAWLLAHGLTAVERPQWRVPTADELIPGSETASDDPAQADEARNVAKQRAAYVDTLRKQLYVAVDLLPTRDLEAALAFLEFLQDRRHPSRAAQRAGDHWPRAGENGED